MTNVTKLTIYVKPQDADVWDRAKKHAEATGVSLATLLVDALHAYIKDATADDDPRDLSRQIDALNKRLLGFVEREIKKLGKGRKQ